MLSFAATISFVSLAVATGPGRRNNLVGDLSRRDISSDFKPGSYAVTRSANASCAPYWLENIKHQGLASFNTGSNGTYKIFRNVKDYGAAGDGVADDTAAIQRAISDGNRCAPAVCKSTTTTPATVYFPSGTYKISQSIIDYYYTQIIGNPNCPPTIKAASNFSTTAGIGLIDGSPYGANGLGYGATNTFFRQIRNLVLDSTDVPPMVDLRVVHWPTAQTTSIQNVVFNMSQKNGTQHQGLFIEQGSGGFLTDLVFHGGLYGFNVGNQQFTSRNLTFHDCGTAINQLWDWGWTYKSVSINNCKVGFNISSGSPAALTVGSITILDSSIKNTPIGLIGARTNASQPVSAGNVYLENVDIENVSVAVGGPNGSTALAGSQGAITITAWADGHRYLPNGPLVTKGTTAPSDRPSALLDSFGKYYERSKPQYGDIAVDQILSARSLGARGDGITDDTSALNQAIMQAKVQGTILFLDAGFYRVTGTVYIPAGSKIVGEALASVFLSSGSFFDDIDNPQPVVQVGLKGEHGTVELQDFFVSPQGRQAGAILIEYNLYTTEAAPSGVWDVHTRVGGFAGSKLQAQDCPVTPNITVTAANLNQNCVAAYMSMHITKWASNVYLENNWLWVADHDIDDVANNNTQITIYAGRGLLVEALQGKIWLYGTAVEHHVKYQYQFVETRDIFMGQIQTETAYYQPNPDASIPFPVDVARNDPVFTSSANQSTDGTGAALPSIANGLGLRIVDSSSLFVYGAGLYSFFANYSTSCSAVFAPAQCQASIFSIEGGLSYDINVYNLNTVGVVDMVTRNGKAHVESVDNNSTFVDGINVLRVPLYA